MVSLKVAFCSILLFAAQQVHSGKEDAFSNTDDVEAQLANVLMVVQSCDAVHETDPHNEVKCPDGIKDWTVGYLLAGQTKNVQTCDFSKRLSKQGPPPDNDRVLTEIWPSFYRRENTNDYIERSWQAQAKCIEASEQYKPQSCGSPDDQNFHDKQAQCYYKQAQQLYYHGMDNANVPYKCQKNIKDHTVSTYVQQSLECLFKENGDKKDGALKIDNTFEYIVQTYFSSNFVYLGCRSATTSRKMSDLTPAARYINGTTNTLNKNRSEKPLFSQCYITRVGLCFQCSPATARYHDIATCTPDPDAPGTYTSCPKDVNTVTTLPWYSGDDAVEEKLIGTRDVSCYTQCEEIMPLKLF